MSGMLSLPTMRDGIDDAAGRVRDQAIRMSRPSAGLTADRPATASQRLAETPTHAQGEVAQPICGLIARGLQFRTLVPYDRAMDHVTLPPELERFATEAVAAGRYRDVSDALAAGLRLLQQAEAEVTAFVASLEAARAEANRDGWHSLDEVMAEADRIIAAKPDAA